MLAGVNPLDSNCPLDVNLGISPVAPANLLILLAMAIAIGSNSASNNKPLIILLGSPEGKASLAVKFVTLE